MIKWRNSLKFKVVIHTLFLIFVLVGFISVLYSNFQDNIISIGEIEEIVFPATEAILMAEIELVRAWSFLEDARLDVVDPGDFFKVTHYESSFMTALLRFQVYYYAFRYGTMNEEFQKAQEGLVYREWKRHNYFGQVEFKPMPDEFIEQNRKIIEISEELFKVGRRYMVTYRQSLRNQLIFEQDQKGRKISDAQLRDFFTAARNTFGDLQHAVLDYEQSMIAKYEMEIENFKEEQNSIVNIFILIVVPVLFGAAILSHYFLKINVLAPLNLVKKRMLAVKKGDYEARVNYSKRDEFGELSGAFDEMMDELKITKTEKKALDDEVQERRKVEQRLKEASKAINEQRQLLQAILDNLSEGVIVSDAKGEFLFFNPYGRKLTGVGPVEGGHKCWAEKYGLYHTDQRTLLKPDELPTVRALKGETVHGEILYMDNDKMLESRFVIVDAVPIKDGQGNVQGSVTSFRDVTDQIRREDRMEAMNKELVKSEKATLNMLKDLQVAHKNLQVTQSQLVQTEKLASIGQLAAGIAHEINNPVGFISNNLQVLGKYFMAYEKLIAKTDEVKQKILKGPTVKADELIKEIDDMRKELKIDFIQDDFHKLMEESTRGIKRIRRIVNDLRTFARKEDDVVSPVSLNSILNEVLTIVHNELKYKAEVVVELNDDCQIMASEQRLGQVFINLLINAVQAIDKHGKVTLSTKEEGGFAVVRISDTGCGIPKDKLDKIFDPFFTTKPVGQGTGLGLSIAYDIVKSQNGEITVESEEGKGTTFTLKFPLKKG